MDASPAFENQRAWLGTGYRQCCRRSGLGKALVVHVPRLLLDMELFQIQHQISHAIFEAITIHPQAIASNPTNPKLSLLR